MEDAQIIDHFFRRDPEAIRAAQEKYEKRCLAAARHILPDARLLSHRSAPVRWRRISPPSPAAWPWTSATITAPPSAAAT